MSVLNGQAPLPPLKDGATEEAITFDEEMPGWSGYINWEKYPEKKKKASRHLAKYKFENPPEFQLVPLPNTNPIIEGVRWKQYHAVMGPTLAPLPDISWKYVQKEKANDMLHVLQFPYNGEPPRTRLVETPVTRNVDHFVRNHGGIPEIDFDAYKLEIGGSVRYPRSFTMKELMDEATFPRMSAMVSIQCSGTRRIEQIRLYPGDGDELVNAPWGEGAIGTARWTGVDLKKVIKACGGLKDGAQHLEFIGADTYFKKGQVYNYAVSVPWRKIKRNEVMLAWEMNGEQLPKIHGFPVIPLVRSISLPFANNVS